MARRNLTKRFIERAPQGRHTDASGFGLSLCVDSRGRKFWHWRGVVKGTGRQVTLGLGSANLVSIDEAREQAMMAKKKARQGINPQPEIVQQNAIEAATLAPTLREAIADCIKARKATWKNPAKTERRWEKVTESHAARLVNRRVDAIEPKDIQASIDRSTNMGNEALGYLNLTFDMLLAHGVVKENVSRQAAKVMLAKPAECKHHESLPYRNAPSFFRAVAASTRSAPARLALQWIMLSGCRLQEACKARWSEFDLDAKVWTVPAGRMKKSNEWDVPLTDAMLAVLEQARALPGAGDYVFRNGRKPIGGEAVRRLKGTLDDQVTVHGFRTTFATWAMENTDADEATIERCIGHVVGSASRRAYLRSTMLEARRAIMESWGGFVAGPATKAAAVKAA